MRERNALIVGVTGIVGRNLADRLLEEGWTVYGLARRPEAAPCRPRPLPPSICLAKPLRAEPPLGL